MSSDERPRIKHLAFYPVKSAAGIEVDSANLAESGLSVGNYADHGFMIVRAQPDEKGVHHFVTQRDKRTPADKPQGLSVLALIKPELYANSLRLTWSHGDPVEIPYDFDQGRELSVRVWEDACLAIDQGDRAAKWLSDHLDMPVRLVKAAGRFGRKASQNYVRNNNPVRFQDAYPVHWFTIESVHELSGIAGQDIPWQSFRPQIVMEGMPARYEHRIGSGIIGKIPFIDPKPCDRCPVTGVDQETGMLREKKPLSYLSTYKNWLNRNGERKVIFGENMLPLDRGVVTVGDRMDVTSYRNPPLAYGASV